jgi:uncharacterized protein (TIGR02678 family)
MSVSLDELERRQAFTGLLATPVVTPHAHPDLWALVRRHRPTLAQWFRDRLGYRLVVSPGGARMYRPPLDTGMIAPARPRPGSRRILVLALLAAAAAEDAEDLTTTQELSDRVRALADRDDVEVVAYEPDRFVERQLFVRAVELLTSLGALRPAATETEEALSGWAHQEDAIGGIHHVEREALLRLVDPVALVAALDQGDQSTPGDGLHRLGLMRRLLELPVCLFEDLTPDERRYLVSQRHRLIAWCHEMTGWVAEQRTEGIALVASDENATDLPFPKLKAEHFAALILLDLLLRDGAVEVDAASLRAKAELVRRQYPKAMTVAFQEQVEVLEQAAIEVLSCLDLIRPLGSDEWRIMPAAARFRNPKVVESAQMRIDDLVGQRDA